MKTLLLSIFVFLGFHVVQAQVLPSDTVPAKINYTTENGVTKFSAELRPLRPISGAPAPFYTYFWEFGDGGFSFEKDPLHIYNSSNPTMVRLFATNNYDDGKHPPTRPRPIKPTKPSGGGKPMLASNTPNFFKMGGSIELKSNAMPKPGDDMMLVFGYRNKASNGQPNLNGTLAILYNDREFSNNNFVLTEARTYFGEQKADLKPMMQTAYLPQKNKTPVYYASANPELTLPKADQVLFKDKAKDFKNQVGWRFEGLKTDEERFLFLEFKTTAEMLKDTNAVVRLSAVFIPDNPLVEKEFFNLELQIVASHDPNKMVLRKSRMNYRLTSKSRELTYKIRFQNTGKGPAKKVDVAVNVASVFDPATLKVTQTKPEVITCDSAYSGQSCLKVLKGTDSVHFVFSNIYLPGLDQKGVNDADSTMGFVEYKIRFKEKPEKLPIKSGAAIVFDKNEPIYTNRAVGRFKMGLSPGIILGYGLPFETNNQNFLNSKNIVIGASLAPYAPHRTYWQVEIFLNTFKENTYLVSSTTTAKDTVINNTPYRIDKKDYYKTKKVITINAVPLQVRYNLNKYVGAGAGALVSLNLYDKDIDELRYNLTAANGVGKLNLDRIANSSKKHFSDLNASLFADVQFGLVRVGPSIGFRYLYDPKTNNNRMASYVTWKF
ncbi:PKD domain-containing protein [Pedobacter sp. ASV12]|uniref:PKD domain-containing protein n=1 Tax=Pedobacter sp. ASV12 TaxID=2795120 RepID=UPI0018EBDFD3|nr:PKD domain-containing protein [Pedobacter sp. ASV12]